MGFPQRKSARREGQTPSSLPEWFTSQQPKWVPFGLDAMRNLLRVCTALQAQIVLAIVERTVGDFENDRPEWSEVTYDDFREMGIDATDGGLGKALAGLSDGAEAGKFGPEAIEGLKLIERRGDNRNRAYRILYRNFRKAERRDPRKIERLAVVAKSGGSRQQLGYKQPMQIPLAKPTQNLEVVRETNGDLPLEFTWVESETGVKVRLYLPEITGEAKAESSTPVEDSTAALPEVKSMPRGYLVQQTIGTAFVNLFGKPLDNKFAGEISARLGPGEPAALLERLLERRPKKSGLVLSLADDVRVAHEERATWKPAGRVEQEPTPPPFEAEPYSSQSPWAQIRARMKGKLHRQEFENWLHHTRFESFQNGVLSVRVVDAVHAEFLDQEYGEQLKATAWELDLKVESIHWVIPAAAKAATVQ